MKLQDRIKAFFGVADNHTLRVNTMGGLYMPELTCHAFGETIFLNIAQILTDIYAELIWQGVDTAKYRAWSNWANRNGQRILLQLMRGNGYVVVGYESRATLDGKEDWVFYELPTTEYMVLTDNERTYVKCNNPEQRFYVLKSPTFEQTGASDHTLCKGYIAMLDAVLNGATTTAERLGAYVVMTPKADNFGGVMLKEDKDQLEKELAQEYGMLKKQKQIMLLNRPMDSQVVSLAGVDLRMNDKARIAILAIADRLKVPANQIAIIDANSSKALSNGTELREGDTAKYRSFRRLIDATLFDMATELGLQVDYTLENEPKTVQGQTIESNE